MRQVTNISPKLREEMKEAAYGKLAEILSMTEFSIGNTIIPIREVTGMITAYLNDLYVTSTRYGVQTGVPLRRELQSIAQEAARMHGFEKRHVAIKPRSDSLLEAIVMPSDDSQLKASMPKGGSNVDTYWVRPYIDGGQDRLTDHLGPEP